MGRGNECYEVCVISLCNGVGATVFVKCIRVMCRSVCMFVSMCNSVCNPKLSTGSLPSCV